MGAIETFRDALFGNPPSATHEPSREGSLAAFTELYNASVIALYATLAGITTVANIAARDSFYATVENRSKLVYVNNNNGVADDPLNGIYEYVSGSARLAEGFYFGLAAIMQPLVDEAVAARDLAEAWADSEGEEPGGPGTKSAREWSVAAASIVPGMRPGVLFDPETVISSYRVRADGALDNPDANHDITALINVSAFTDVLVFGLPAAAFYDGAPYYRWVDADGTTPVAPFGNQIKVRSSNLLTRPEDATYLQFGVRVGVSALPDYSTLRVVGLAPITNLGGLTVSPNVTDYGGFDNQFISADVQEGFEVLSNGGVAPNAFSTVAPPIYCEGQEYISFGGFPPTDTVTENFRYYFFTDRYGTLVEYGNFIPALITDWTIPVPDGAVYCVISPYQRCASDLDLSTAWIQIGNHPTRKRPYLRTICSIDNVPLPFAPRARQYDTAGDVAYLGDSNMTIASRLNWPRWVPRSLGQTGYNYAVSGASLRDRGADSCLKDQIDALIAAHPARDFRFIVIGLGTNDAIGMAASALKGTADVAATQAVAIGSLSQTDTYEAARAGFYRLRQQYPDAVLIWLRPTQRNFRDDGFAVLVNDADGDREDFYDGIAELIAEYAGEEIDAYNKSGILRAEENANAPGANLRDGLHQNDYPGENLVGQLVIREMRRRWGMI